MTKVELLKAKAYVIKHLENQVECLQEDNERSKGYYEDEETKEIPSWVVQQIAENNKNITYINAIIEEIAK